MLMVEVWRYHNWLYGTGRSMALSQLVIRYWEKYGPITIGYMVLVEVWRYHSWLYGTGRSMALSQLVIWYW